jgi:hypothetical protein
LDELPVLSKSCQNFCTIAQEIAEARRLNKITLQQHAQLIELLEIPQLMDTCVRNGFYDEALQLEEYAHRLEKIHPNVSVVQEIVADVKASSEVMLHQLQQKLRGDTQLAQCLKIVGYLRRLGVYDELQLRISFLKSRDAWFSSVISNIPVSNSYNYVSYRYIF